MVKLDYSLRAATARVIWPASLLRSDASRAPQTSSLPGAERKESAGVIVGAFFVLSTRRLQGENFWLRPSQTAREHLQHVPCTASGRGWGLRRWVVVASFDFISLERSSTDSEAITVVSVVSRIGRNTTFLQERRARIQLSHR